MLLMFYMRIFKILNFWKYLELFRKTAFGFVVLNICTLELESCKYFCTMYTDLFCHGFLNYIDLKMVTLHKYQYDYVWGGGGGGAHLI